MIASVAAACGAGVILASVSESARYAGAWAEAVESGRFVIVASATTSAGLDAGRCESINTFTGVEAAGAVLSRRDVQFSMSGNQRWTEMTVTPHFAAAAWAIAPPPTGAMGVFSGNELRELLGLRQGSTLAVSSIGDEAASLARVNWVAPGRARIEGINRSIFTIGDPVGAVEACYVSAYPAAFEKVGAAVADWFEQPVQVSGLTAAHEGSEIALTPSRLVDWGWVCAALVVVLLTSAWWLARRADYALYRVLGMTSRALLLMASTEALLLALVPSALGATVVIWILHPNDAYVLAALAADSARFTLTLIPLPLIVAAISRRRNTLRSLNGF